MRKFGLLLLPVFALAGCGMQAHEPPVSTAPSPGPSSQAPQAPNSLPNGAATAAPLTSRTGTVGNSRVGPRY